jgi:glycine/D-amino acid oxidase-like deaminating enzyme
MDLTERHDLRSGTPPWTAERDRLSSAPFPSKLVDVAICGAGVTGAMLAERLATAGLSVAVVDRRKPAAGSTAASTALVLWEADIPLTLLAAQTGEAEAVKRWQAVRRVVRALADRIDGKNLDADRIDRPSLYLAGDMLDAEGLKQEAALRRRHQFPSVFLDPDETANRFGIPPIPAIMSADSYEVDPIKLTLELLERAKSAGATISFPVDALGIRHGADDVVLETSAGPLRARHVILATGYERPHLFLPPRFELRTSYAIATTPGIAPLWRENAMIWQASKSYIYARADADGRIIAGGGDDFSFDGHHRERLIPTKAAQIASDLGRITGSTIDAHYRWGALFGTSPDGLPDLAETASALLHWLQKSSRPNSPGRSTPMPKPSPLIALLESRSNTPSSNFGRQPI